MPSTAGVRVGGLPVEPNSFVGRRRELAKVKQSLASTRLVTVIGAGGVGKTRLALRVAASAQRSLPGGSWLVDLTDLHGAGDAEVPDEDALAQLTASVLGLHDAGTGPPLRQLTEQLSQRRPTLLVLDNCEHLLAVCARFADCVLRQCPKLRILTTSREPLAISGEQVCEVPPMSAPPPNEPIGDADRYDCVQLFADRARAVMPTFRIDEDNWPAVGELCRRLDGLPLAIELAAARVRVLSPGQILQRLGDRFRLLSRGMRAVPHRQRTLLACLDWSYDLCLKPEQALWGRSAVFVGGFELDAVEDVCADEMLAVEGCLEQVAGLLDKSVLVRSDSAGDGSAPARYRMLESIREYGQEKLVQASEQPLLRRRHREWYRRLVDRAAAEWISDRQSYWHARLTREQANVRAAIEYYLAEPGHADTALHIAVTVPSGYWWRRGLFRESRRWLDRTLAHTDAPTALRAQALLLDGHLAILQGDFAGGTRLLEEGEDLARRLRHATVELALAAHTRGVVALYRGDLPAAAQAFERTLDQLPATPRPESGREMELRLSAPVMLGIAAALAGDHERADSWYRNVLEITERLGESHYQAAARWPLALSSWRQGKVHEATTQLLATLRLKRGPGSADRFGAAQCVEGLAWTAASQERFRRAAMLLGAADALWTESGLSVTGFQHLIGYHDGCVRQVRDALGAGAYRRGEALSYDDAIVLALDEQRPSAAPTNKFAPLTRRERQVAELLGTGLSNREIAAALVVSTRTAESHVEHILTKLGLANRAQVAAWVSARRTSDESRSSSAVAGDPPG